MAKTTQPKVKRSAPKETLAFNKALLAFNGAQTVTRTSIQTMLVQSAIRFHKGNKDTSLFLRLLKATEKKQGSFRHQAVLFYIKEYVPFIKVDIKHDLIEGIKASSKVLMTQAHLDTMKATKWWTVAPNEKPLTAPKMTLGFVDQFAKGMLCGTIDADEIKGVGGDILLQKVKDQMTDEKVVAWYDTYQTQQTATA